MVFECKYWNVNFGLSKAFPWGFHLPAQTPALQFPLVIASFSLIPDSPSPKVILQEEDPSLLLLGVERASAHLEKHSTIKATPALLEIQTAEISCRQKPLTVDESNPFPHIKGLKHFVSLQQALGCFQALYELLGVLGVSAVCLDHCSFQGSTSLSAVGYLIPPPCRWKTHPDNTLQCLVLLLDSPSDLVFAVTFQSHQDCSALKHEATWSLG